MSDPKLSIIVPIYDVERYLERCINSLINQTFSDIEIVLVDDGSKDNCGKICEDYAKKDDRIKVIHKQNGGLVSAWKMGVKNASSEYVGFVDPDDYCNADYFQQLFSPIMQDSTIDFVSGGFVIVDGEKQYKYKYSTRLEAGTISGLSLDSLKQNFFSGGYTIAPSRWSKIVRKTIVLQNEQLIDNKIKMAEDVCATFSWLLDSNKIALVDTYGYNYFIYNSSMSKVINNAMLDNNKVIYEVLTSIKNEKNYSGNISQILLEQLMDRVLKILVANVSKKEKISLLKYLQNIKGTTQILASKQAKLNSKSQKIVKFLFKNKCYSLLILLSNIYSKNK